MTVVAYWFSEENRIILRSVITGDSNENRFLHGANVHRSAPERSQLNTQLEYPLYVEYVVYNSD